MAPTNNDPKHRTSGRNVPAGSPQDSTKYMPWRSPGTAPVLGSGCGIAGGNKVMLPNGGTPPDGIAQATDGLRLPAQPPAVWSRGSVEEVAWGITAK